MIALVAFAFKVLASKKDRVPFVIAFDAAAFNVSSVVIDIERPAAVKELKVKDRPVEPSRVLKSFVKVIVPAVIFCVSVMVSEPPPTENTALSGVALFHVAVPEFQFAVVVFQSPLPPFQVNVAAESELASKITAKNQLHGEIFL